jgi:raffinose/stachyose/melibiose transport system substrate-binding protein
MKKSVRFLAVCLSMLMLVSLIGACGTQKEASPDKTAVSEQGTTQAPAATKAAEKVKIRFAYNWTGTDSKAPIFEASLKKFQDENPDIELTLEATPGMDHQTKIKTDSAAGNIPEAFNYWGTGYLEPLVKAGLIADLSDLLKNDADLKDRFLEGGFTDFTFDGKVYGVPAESYFAALYLNSDLFKKFNLEYPKTFDDLKNVVKTFKANGIIPIAEGGKGGDPSALLASAFIYEMGGATVVDDIMNKGDYTSVSKSYASLQELVKLGAFQEGINAASQDEKMALFNDEKAAMIYDGSWMLGAVKPELASKVDFTPFPTLPGGKADPSGLVAGVAMCYSISADAFKDEAKKDAVLKLVKYISSPEANKEMLEKASIPPSVKITVDESKLSPIMAKAAKLRLAATEAVPAPTSYFPAALNEKLVTHLQAQFEALETPQAYVDVLAEGLKK